MSNIRFICRESEFTENLMNWLYTNYKSELNEIECDCYIRPINEWTKVKTGDVINRYEIMDEYENLITLRISTTLDGYICFHFMRISEIIIQWIESKNNIFRDKNIYQSSLLLLHYFPDMLLVHIRLYEDNLRLVKDNEKLTEEIERIKYYSPDGEGYHNAKLHFEYLSRTSSNIQN